MGMTRAVELPAAVSEADLADTVPADWPNAKFSRIVESFGTRWHLQSVGSGPPIVLLHGTAASTHSYRDVIPVLAKDFSVLALDLPGHAYSSRLPDGDMSLNAIVRALSGLFETLAIRPRFMVGHSAGAAIALRHALDQPAGIEAIVGLNAALLPFGGLLQGLFSPMAQFFASTRLMPLMLAKRAADRKAVERVIRGTGSVIDAYGIDLYQRLFEREGHIASVLAMMAAWDLGGLHHDLPKLEPRLLLVSGGRDRAVSPREATRVAGDIRRAEIVEFDDCGHLAHEEHPARVAATIAKFCLEPNGPGDDSH